MAAGVAVGCARSPGVPSGAAGTDGAVRGQRLGEDPTLSDDSADEADYDPWQSFNERMFSFNHDVLDGWLVKPAAQGWAKICPEVARRSFARLINNLDMPRRLVNNLLQARPLGAGARAGALRRQVHGRSRGSHRRRILMHVEPSEADSGETLALYGIDPPSRTFRLLRNKFTRLLAGQGIDG
jgi:phospholipid-binding lipoprotein MlaA